MLQALDEAIAEVTWGEYIRLKKMDPGSIAAQVQDAFESLDRLQTGGVPNYNEWDAPFYLSWYQARQVHLVCAAIRQFPPPSSGGPLHVIDFGCGAWTVPIALAILAAEDHEALRNRQVSVHGIEPSKAMTRLGRELWLEFGCAAENLGFDIDFIHEMIDDDSIFETEDAYWDARSHSPNTFAESWVLAIHALYDESKSDIARFLSNCRTRHANRLRYVVLSTDQCKQRELMDLIFGGMRSSISIDLQQPDAQREMRLLKVKPIWAGILQKTSECRTRICEELEKQKGEGSLSPKYLRYLRSKVEWQHRRNPISDDAVGVSGPLQTFFPHGGQP